MKSKLATPENFSKYGRVVKFPKGEPTSQAADYKFWSDIADFNIDGSTEIGICTVYRQPGNTITGMERHMNTPEVLIPIDAPFALPVSNGIESEIFTFNIGEAVIIERGIWHGACLPVKAASCSYYVIFKKRTPFEDVEKKTINPVNAEL